MTETVISNWTKNKITKHRKQPHAFGINSCLHKTPFLLQYGRNYIIDQKDAVGVHLLISITNNIGMKNIGIIHKLGSGSPSMHPLHAICTDSTIAITYNYAIYHCQTIHYDASQCIVYCHGLTTYHVIL